LQIGRFFETLKEQADLIIEFSPKMFISIVDIVEVFCVDLLRKN